MNRNVLKILEDPNRPHYFALIPELLWINKHHKFARLANTLTMKYQMIMHYLDPGSTLLEICCGAGYGAEILQKSGYNIMCFDNNPFLVELTKARGLYAQKEDILTVKFSDNMFDGGVFVDAIEHFEQKDQEKIISLFHGALKPGGIFLIDTPCAPRTGYVNKEHLWELNWEDFGKLLSPDKFEILARFVIRWDELAVPLRKDKATLKEILGSMSRGMAIDQVIIAKKI